MKLYVIIDEALIRSRDVREVTEQVIGGGADAVQWRAKHSSKRRYYEKAASLLPIARRHGIPFFVNDHLDIALAISSDGVHLGQNDLPADAARRLMPAKMLLGISTHSTEEAIRAVRDGADYVAIGPVFPTATKENPEAAVGPQMIRRIKECAGSVPVVAIGGIGSDNVREVVRAGADGIAVASAVLTAQDPSSAALRLRDRVLEEFELRGGPPK